MERNQLLESISASVEEMSKDKVVAGVQYVLRARRQVASPR